MYLYVFVSMAALLVSLIFKNTLGATLQSHFYLWGMSLTQFFFLLCALGTSVIAVLISQRQRLPWYARFNLKETMALYPPMPWQPLGSLPLAIAGFAFTTIASVMLSWIFPEAVAEVSERYTILFSVYPRNLPMLLCALALFPAICEEALFRGLVYWAFARYTSERYTVYITAVLFALFHVSPILFPTSLIMGLLLGYARRYSCSIYPPVLIHLINNSIVVILTWYNFDMSIIAPYLPAIALLALFAGKKAME